MQAKRFIAFILAVFLSSVLVVTAANPSSPISPGDNIQDPGDPATAWGGCEPTDSNCYVTSLWQVSSDDIYYNSGNVGGWGN